MTGVSWMVTDPRWYACCADVSADWELITINEKVFPKTRPPSSAALASAAAAAVTATGLGDHVGAEDRVGRVFGHTTHAKSMQNSFGLELANPSCLLSFLRLEHSSDSLDTNLTIANVRESQQCPGCAGKNRDRDTLTFHAYPHESPRLCEMRWARSKYYSGNTPTVHMVVALRMRW